VCVGEDATAQFNTDVDGEFDSIPARQLFLLRENNEFIAVPGQSSVIWACVSFCWRCALMAGKWHGCPVSKAGWSFTICPLVGVYLEDKVSIFISWVGGVG